MTKFDRETFATTSLFKEGGEEPVSFGHVEVVMALLGPAEVVMIIKTLDMMLALCVHRIFVKDNKDDVIDDDEPCHSGLITLSDGNLKLRCSFKHVSLIKRGRQ